MEEPSSGSVFTSIPVSSVAELQNTLVKHVFCTVSNIGFELLTGGFVWFLLEPDSLLVALPRFSLHTSP
jgi:hypothetical protein